MRIAMFFAGAVVVGKGFSASAQVDPIDPFVGDISEGFESQCPCDPPFYACVPGGIFGGTADLCAQSAHLTGGWGFDCGLSPHGGGWLYGSTGSASTITFNGDLAGQFGGYFASNAPGQTTATLDFYGVDGFIDSDQVSVLPGCAWAWAGWEFGEGVEQIVITGDAFAGFIMLDDMEFTAAGGGKCAADCNGDGNLDVLDFVCFQGEWQGQTDAGDCDGNGSYDILDFVCYQGLFQDGCP
jgi:hypothetical protein